jgi:predicted ATPase
MMCPLLLGWTVFTLANRSEGLQHMDRAIAAKRQRPHRFYFEYELLVFAEALLKGGEVGRALDVVEEVLEFIRTSGSRVFEAEAYRVKGACLAIGADRASEAEALLVKAIDTADKQGALSFQLRAVTNLGRLWSEQNRRAEAHHALAPVYERFTEGFDTPDLKAAKALLDELNTPLRVDVLNQ